GDGVFISGTAANPSNRVWVDRCKIEANRRSQVTVEAAHHVKITKNYIDNNTSGGSSIDFEPTELAPFHDAYIAGNTILQSVNTGNYVIALSGQSPANPWTNIRLVG